MPLARDYSLAGFLLSFPVVDLQFSPGQLEALLPLAVDWAAEQQARILQEGLPLSSREIADAKAAGVQKPAAIRVLPVTEIPAPQHPLLKAVMAGIQFLIGAPRGLTLGYGIFVRSDCRQDRHVIAHELAHISQYERLGGIFPFLRKYLFECSTLGYRKAPLEIEANDIAQRISTTENIAT